MIIILIISQVEVSGTLCALFSLPTLCVNYQWFSHYGYIRALMFFEDYIIACYSDLSIIQNNVV